MPLGLLDRIRSDCYGQVNQLLNAFVLQRLLELAELRSRDAFGK